MPAYRDSIGTVYMFITHRELCAIVETKRLEIDNIFDLNKINLLSVYKMQRSRETHFAADDDTPVTPMVG